MWYAAVMRFLRRRIVLGVIFSLSLTYCIVSFVRDTNPDADDYYSENDVAAPAERSQPFIWRSLQELNSSNETTDAATRCRNSIQGQVLIVDDRGYVCGRVAVLASGCCAADLHQQYACTTCLPHHCCAVYEYCVSCCLHPDKKPVLEQILGRATRENNVLFAAVSDHFELCLAKCRTNSLSVQHENSYRDPQAKYCYGESAPNATND